MNKALNYNLKDISLAVDFIIKNTTSKTLLFNGVMGSGKTTLIKALVNRLGSTDNVSSPTFSIVNEYKLNESTIFHFDFYRIENEFEVRQTTSNTDGIVDEGPHTKNIRKTNENH